MVNNLRGLRDQIGYRIDELGDYLAATPPVVSELMTISRLSRKEERIKSSWEGFKVQHVSGEQAVTRIIDALKDFGTDNPLQLNEESTKFTAKYPGLVVVPDKAEKLRKLIEEINNAKNQFARALMSLSTDRHKRFDEVHEQFPGLVTLQATRNILFSDIPLKKVTFGWRYNRNTEKKTKHELIDILTGRKEALFKNLLTRDQTERLSTLDYAIKKLASMHLQGEEGFRLCRVNSFPVPIVHAWFEGDDRDTQSKNKYLSTKASLPLFATGSFPVPQLKLLSDWDQSVEGDKAKSGRQTPLVYTELVPGADLGIFIVRAASHEE